MKLPSWFENALHHPQVTDIVLNGFQYAFLDQGQGFEAIPEAKLQPFLQLKEWVLAQLSTIGKTWDAQFPFIDATLLSDHRIHVVFPPLSHPHPILISLRRLGTRSFSNRWNQGSFFQLLKQAILEKQTILISGATGSGKTTLMNDLISLIPSHQRVIALEDTPELSPVHPHFLSLQSRPASPEGKGEVTLRDLLKQILRMRADRIILGESRGHEVLELLQALNTGHLGSLLTIHANSAKDALKRIELLCLIAAQGAIPIHAIRELLSLGIQWIAHLNREKDERKIAEVFKIEGNEEDIIFMRPYKNE